MPRREAFACRIAGEMRIMSGSSPGRANQWKRRPVGRRSDASWSSTGRTLVGGGVETHQDQKSGVRFPAQCFKYANVMYEQ